MSNVYVIQEVHSRNRETGVVGPQHDLTPAEDFGVLCVLLGPEATPLRPRTVIQELREKLQDFTSDDYLLPVGNPCFIAWASIIARERTLGPLKFLMWHRPAQAYLSVESEF